MTDEQSAVQEPGIADNNSEELFCSSGFAPELEAINWLVLPPIVRVLLTTDGTVTKSLESYCWESVNVVCQQQVALVTSATLAANPTWATNEKQAKASLSNEASNSATSHSQQLWQRDVLLVGEQSQKTYVEASSIVCFALLPQKLSEGLRAGRLGIGEIIRSLGMETYRRIVAVGQLPVGENQPERVWRQYNLYYQGRILMQIKEEFILKAFT